MANRKITQFAALASGAQAPTMVLPIVDPSLGSTAAANKKVTLNNLFADLGLNTTDKGIAQTGVFTGSAPAVSAAGQMKWYYNITDSTFKLSRNTGLYGTVQVNNAASVTPGAGTTQTIDLSIRTMWTILLPAGNITVSTAGTQLFPTYFTTQIIQDAVGGRTIIWGGTLFNNSAAMTVQPDATANSTTTFNWYSDGTNCFLISWSSDAGNFAIPTSTYAGLPAAPGYVAEYLLTDTNKSVWAYNTNASQWVSQNGQVYNVKDFGAKGDGVTDDTAAIQAAINAAPNYSTVILPSTGTFTIGTAGILFSNKTGLIFTSLGAKLLLTAVSTQVCPGFSNTSILFSSCARSGMVGIEIDGNSKATNAVGIYAGTDCFVDQNTIYSCGANAQIVATGGGSRNKFRRNLVYSSTGVARGVWLGNNNAIDMENDIEVIANTIRNNGASGLIVASNGGRVELNHSKANAGAGIVFPGANGYTANNIVAAGNYCTNNSFHGIQSDVVYTSDADLTYNITVIGNNCCSNSSSGIYASNSLYWNITGNTCTNNVTAGIQTDDRANFVNVTANNCSDTRSGGSRTQGYGIRVIAQTVGCNNIVITGNNCSNNTGAGIRVSSSGGGILIANVSISGNTCSNNAIWGVFMSEVNTGDLSYITLTSNVCLSNTTLDLRISILDCTIVGNRYSTSQSVDYVDITGATPSVNGRILLRANNGGATTVTAFNGAVNGQTIQIFATNGNTTIAQGGLINNKGGVNVTIPSQGTIAYTFQAGSWREIFRSF